MRTQRAYVDDSQYLQLHARGLSDREAAAILHVTLGAVRSCRRWLHLPPTHAAPRRVDEHKLLMAYQAGLSDQKMAETAACSIKTALTFRRRHNFPPNQKYRKADQKIIRRVVAEYKTLKGVAEIAYDCGISESLVYIILRKADVKLTSDMTGFHNYRRPRHLHRYGSSKTRLAHLPARALIDAGIDPEKELLCHWTVEENTLRLMVREAPTEVPPADVSRQQSKTNMPTQ